MDIPLLTALSTGTRTIALVNSFNWCLIRDT
jgi:hypothetical protein